MALLLQETAGSCVGMLAPQMPGHNCKDAAPLIAVPKIPYAIMHLP